MVLVGYDFSENEPLFSVWRMADTPGSHASEGFATDHYSGRDCQPRRDCCGQLPPARGWAAVLG